MFHDIDTGGEAKMFDVAEALSTTMVYPYSWKLLFTAS
jgi:hypothetical protein